ncbi:hypothetical protein ET495_00580 [Xylanimonas allomyrinae]|uniref:Uncharacterized protein n=1 Tax=Xylanimonas allomyrinae TaxID=2509459 RepID=A0A4P6EIA6_9MICO|nr:hypothetical protein [Xylanimonas allomyrinae]QAY62035.1 hypothetical protein ET495_00580 [Xylanimonas allomyrinae]
MSSLTAALAGQLSKGISVELVGRPCSGRSDATERVAERLQSSGQRTVQVAGVGAMRDRPLGALLTRFPELVGNITVANAVTVLGDEVASHGTLLVDDADDLDDLTIGVIAAVRAQRPVSMLVVRRTGSQPTSALRALLAALQPSVRRTVPR